MRAPAGPAVVAGDSKRAQSPDNGYVVAMERGGRIVHDPREERYRRDQKDATHVKSDQRVTAIPLYDEVNRVVIGVTLRKSSLETFDAPVVAGAMTYRQEIEKLRLWLVEALRLPASEHEEKSPMDAKERDLVINQRLKHMHNVINLCYRCIYRLVERPCMYIEFMVYDHDGRAFLWAFGGAGQTLTQSLIEDLERRTSISHQIKEHKAKVAQREADQRAEVKITAVVNARIACELSKIKAIEHELRWLDRVRVAGTTLGLCLIFANMTINAQSGL